MTYDYRVVRVLRVVDGDTLDAVLDLGFYLTAALRFRLLALDTPERGQPGWAESGQFVRDWVVGRNLRATTVKADSFGRWLAHFYDADTGENLSAAVNAALPSLRG